VNIDGVIRGCHNLITSVGIFKENQGECVGSFFAFFRDAKLYLS